MVLREPHLDAPWKGRKGWENPGMLCADDVLTTGLPTPASEPLGRSAAHGIIARTCAPGALHRVGGNCICDRDDFAARPCRRCFSTRRICGICQHPGATEPPDGGIPGVGPHMDQAFCGGHEDRITAHERIDSATVSELRVGEAHDQGAHGGLVSAARWVHECERALRLAKRWRDLRELPGLAALRRNGLPSTRT